MIPSVTALLDSSPDLGRMKKGRNLDFPTPKKKRSLSVDQLVSTDDDIREEQWIYIRKEKNLEIHDGEALSRRFFEHNFLGYDSKNIEGFYDIGRLQDTPSNFISLNEPTKVVSDILLVDSTCDLKLLSMRDQAKEICAGLLDTQLQVKLLSLLVSNLMGGPQRNFVDSLSITEISNQEMKEMQKSSKIIKLGNVSFGLTRHRAILFKHLANNLGIASKLVRVSEPQIKKGANINHIWNIVEIDNQEFIVDTFFHPFSIYEISTESAQRYMHWNEKMKEIPISQSEIQKISRWMRASSISFHEIKKIKSLTKGPTSSLWRCKVGSFTAVVKEFRLDSMKPKEILSAEDEVAILQTLHHEQIISYIGHELNGNTLNLFMEYIPSSLFDQIQEINSHRRSIFSEEEILRLATGILKALHYLHTLPDQVIHRDIKSKNILIELDEIGMLDSIKICDFGSSRRRSTANRYINQSETIGTPRWMAPEIIQGLSHDEKVDIWSFGMALYECLALRIPYHSVLLLDVKDHILKRNLPSFDEVDFHYSKFVDITKLCLRFDPKERPSASHLLDQFYLFQKRR